MSSKDLVSEKRVIGKVRIKHTVIDVEWSWAGEPTSYTVKLSAANYKRALLKPLTRIEDK